MIDSLYIAATGMRAGQESISTISNNLSNLNTVGFKKGRVSFEDVFYKSLKSDSSSRTFSGDLSQMGLGTAIGEIQKVFQAGDLKATQNPFDVAINGKGFLEVVLENGELAYTRDGSLQLDDAGYLQTKNGHRLSGSLRIPQDAAGFKVAEDGVVTAKISDTNEILEVGQIELADFINPSGLQALGNGLYIETEQAGIASYAYPGENSTGKLQQGFLESSNVELVAELMELVIAQQMFSVNSQVVKASDQLMQMVNNLRQ